MATTRLEIKILADTRHAMKRIQGLVKGMKREFGKVGAVGAGPSVDVDSLVNKIIAAQKKLGNETTKTGKKGEKAAKDWRVEWDKLNASLKAASGKESRVGTKIIADMNSMLKKQVSVEAKKKDVSASELEALEKKLKMTSELERKDSLMRAKAEELNKARKKGNKIEVDRNKLLEQSANIISKIQRVRLIHTKGAKKSQIALRHEALKHLETLGLTNTELKKMVKSLSEAREKTTRLARAHRRESPTSALSPLTAEAKFAKPTAEQQLPAGMQAFIHPEHSKAMNTARRFMADFKKYAGFQLRWFASASTIFAVSGAIAAATRNTLQFYQALKDIQAITDKTEQEIRLIGDAAKVVATTTPLAAAQAAKMGLKLVQAGLSARAAAEAMKTVGAVTTVSGENMETVAKSVTTAMFAWNLEASRVPEIGNILAGALNFSRLTVEDLGTAFNYLASTSSIMGRSLKETAASLAVLSNMGIRASTIGTGLSQLMTQLVAPTEKFKTELRRVNLSANEVNPTMNKMSEIIDKLREAGFSAAKSMDILGVRAGRILAASIVATSAEFEKMERRISKQGMLQKALGVAMEGPINAMKRMKNQLEIGIIQIGDAAVPVLKLLADALGWAMGRFRDITALVSMASEAFGGLAVGLTAFATTTLALVASHLVKTGTAIKSVTSATVLLNGAISVLSKHPLILVTGALVAGLSLLGAAFTRSKEKADELALAHDELSVSKERARREAERFRQEEMLLERGFVSLKESWEGLAKISGSLPFASAIAATSMEISSAARKTDQLTESINELKIASQVSIPTFTGISGILDYWVGSAEKAGKAVTETGGILSKIGKFLTDDFNESSVTQWIKGFTGITEANEALAKSAENTRKTLANLNEQLERNVSEGLKKTMERVRKLLVISPDEIGFQFLEKWVEEKQRNPLERLRMFHDEVISKITTAQGALRRQMEVTEAQIKKGLGRKEAAEAHQALAKLTAEYDILGTNLRRVTNEFDLNWDKLINKTKSHEKGLVSTEKRLISIRAELEKLREIDPLRDVAISTRSNTDKTRESIAATTKELEKLQEEYAKAFAVSNPLTKGQKELFDRLSEATRRSIKALKDKGEALREILGLQAKIGEEREEQLRETQALARDKLKAGKALRLIGLQEIALSTKRNAGMMSASAFERQSLELEKLKLKEKLKILTAEKESKYIGDLQREQKQDEIDALNQQLSALDRIVTKSRELTGIEKAKLGLLISQANALAQAADTSIMSINAQRETYETSLASAAVNYRNAVEEYRTASWDQREGARLQMEAAKYSLEQAEHQNAVARKIQKYQDVQRGLGVSMSAFEQYAQEAEQNPYQAEYDAKKAHYEAMQNLQITSMQEAADQERAMLEMNLANEKATNYMKVAGAKATFSALAGAAQAFYALSEGKSKSFFKLYKLASIAEATISTFKTAQYADEWGTRTGSPILGKVWAAAAIVTGMARVAAIQAMQPGMGAAGGGGGGGGGGGSSGYKYFEYESSKYGTGWRAGEGQGPSNYNIIINAVDAKSFKALVDENPEAITGVVTRDIKDGGETKDAINEYA